MKSAQPFGQALNGDSLNRYIGAASAGHSGSSFPPFASVQISEFTKRTHALGAWKGRRGDGEKGGQEREFAVAREFTKRTHLFGISNFRIPDLRLSWNSGHRTPLQRFYQTNPLLRQNGSFSFPLFAPLRLCVRTLCGSGTRVDFAKRTHSALRFLRFLLFKPRNYQTNPPWQESQISGCRFQIGRERRSQTAATAFLPNEAIPRFVSLVFIRGSPSESAKRTHQVDKKQQPTVRHGSSIPTPFSVFNRCFIRGSTALRDIYQTNPW
jgi:hypothetical protein